MKTLVARFHALEFRLPKARYLGTTPDHEGRIRVHQRRVARTVRDPDEPEPLICWGPCGRVLPRYAKPSKQGWRTRQVKCGPCLTYELQCPECYGKWGWIKFKDHEAAATGDHEGHRQKEARAAGRDRDRRLHPEGAGQG